jgi:hypothetical protein
MSAPASNDDVPHARKAWVLPCLTKHASLGTLTQQYQYPPEPYVRGDTLIVGDLQIPCSQGFCP